MSISSLIYRLDLFALEIMVEGFLTVDSMGRKVYSKGRVIKWDVEFGSYTVELLMKCLQTEVNWAPNQSATVWFFHKRLGEDIRLTEKFQMRDLFEMYKSEMRCHLIVAILDNYKITEVVLTDELESLCVIPPDKFEPANQTGASASKVADSQGTAAKEADAVEPDLFDNEEEYVGIDDEHIYTPVPPSSAAGTDNGRAQPAAAHEQAPESSNAHGTSSCPKSNQNGTAAEGGVPLEAEVNDADPQEFNVIHNPEHPNIEKGALFPDIVTFRKAIRHYAVQRGFEFTDLKTDKARFIAKCAHQGYPWRIHAPHIWDKKTIEVTNNVLFV